MASDDPLPFREPLARWAETELGAACEVGAGWPRHARSSEPPRGAGVWLAVETTLAPERRGHLWLCAEVALAVVDRTLGGEAGAPATNHPAASPDPGERGVLAYAAARALATLWPGLRLTGVEAQAPGELHAAVDWPLHVRLGEAEGAARLFVERPAADAWLPATSLHWVLTAEPGELDGLLEGDVALLEAGSRPGQKSWLVGQGIAEPLAVTLEAGAWRRREGPAPDPRYVRLEVQVGALHVTDLADLHAERCLPVGLASGEAPVHLVGPTGARLAGELVRLRGRLGVRIT